MGFFNLFKRKAAINKEEELDFDAAEFLLKERGTQAKKELQKTAKEIKKLLETIQPYLEERIQILENINLQGKKENEKLKRLTQQGITDYTEQLRRLKKELSEIQPTNKVYEYIQKIDKSIHTFIKQSFKQYHRGTILVGNELTQTQEKIKEFYKELNNIAQKNQQYIQEALGTQHLQEQLEKQKEIEETLQESTNTIQALEEEHKAAIQKLGEHRTALATAQEQGTYIEQLAKQLEIKNKLQETNKKIKQLQQQLNLKEIHKRVHGYKRHQETIQNYRENFNKTLLEDENLTLLELLNEEEKETTGDRLTTLRKEILELRKKERNIQPEKILEPIHKNIQEQEQTAQEILDNIELEKKKQNKHHEEKTQIQERKKQILQAALKGITIIY